MIKLANPTTNLTNGKQNKISGGNTFVKARSKFSILEP